MKRIVNHLPLTISVIIVLLALISCEKDDEPKSGKITLSISNASQFNTHTIWYSIWDSYDSQTPDGEDVKIFDPGTYYYFAIVDMNDNFSGDPDGMPDSGDYVGGGGDYPIKVDGDVTKNISTSEFFGPMP